MSHIKETILTFFVTYLSPRSGKLVQPKLIFGQVFQKSPLYNSNVMAGGRWVSRGLPFH